MKKNNKYQEFSDFIEGMTTIVEEIDEDSERLARTEKLLSELISTRSWLPLEKIQPDNDRQYARHSLYHDPEDRFEVLVLVWPPGQETPLHDHDGTWGVEGVIAGRMKVTNYLQLKNNDDNTVKLGRAGVMRINEQSTGELLPPADCHTLEAEGDEVAITVHVYGKKLRKFRVFESLDEDENYSTKEVATGYTTESTLLSAASVSEKYFTPYYGKEYSQPDQVLKQYPDPDVNFDTPAFKNEDEKFTTQEELMSFVRELSDKSHLAEMKIIGYSTEGREIPMLSFRKGENRKEKANVWIQAQIHGNEPAAGETALIIAQRLAGAFGEEILDKINVNLVPRVNPDGAYYFTRQTAKKLDANRDQFKLDTPEVQSVQKAFNQFQPDVSIVGHEDYINHDSSLFKSIGDEGALVYHDVLLNSGRNLGISKPIQDKAVDLFISNAREELTKHGFSNEIYYGSQGRTDQGQLILQELTFGADREPSYYGLQPCYSFITETRGIGIGRESFKRRVTSSVTAQMSLLDTTVKHFKSIKQDIKKARQETVQKGRQPKESDKVAIKIKNKIIPNKEFKVTDISTGKPVDLNVEYLSSSEVTPTLERVRPNKYVLLPGYSELAKKIQINGIEVTKTQRNMKLDAESYAVTDIEVDENQFEGVYQSRVETKVSLKEIELPKGSYVFSMAQPTANRLPVMFEPESPSSYVTWYQVPSKVGADLEIYRVMKPIALNAMDLKLIVESFVIEDSISISDSDTLQVHLTTIDQHEKMGASEKVIEHLKNFKSLLNYQKEEHLISKDVYDYLVTSADSLIEIWEQ